MKIAHLILQHLVHHKKVSLEEVGTFFLSSNLPVQEHGMELMLPENAVTFEYNSHTPVDNSLIDHIVQQTRKIRPLAASDLESYTILGRQFLNLGKPFHIEGLGTLEKTQSGGYEFLQSHSFNTRMEPAPTLIREKAEEDIIFSTPLKKHTDKKALIRILFIIFGLIVLVSGIWAIVSLMSGKKEENLTKVNSIDSITAKYKSDSISRAKDSMALLTPPAPADSGFKIVIKEYYELAQAERLFNKYKSYGLKVILHSEDSLLYKIYIPFQRSLSDTAKVRDSLNKYFKVNTKVEL